jgi:hypothetical protein
VGKNPTAIRKKRFGRLKNLPYLYTTNNHKFNLTFMKRLAFLVTVLAFLSILVSCAGSKNGTGNGCKGTEGFVGYGRK